MFKNLCSLGLVLFCLVFCYGCDEDIDREELIDRIMHDPHTHANQALINGNYDVARQLAEEYIIRCERDMDFRYHQNKVREFLYK